MALLPPAAEATSLIVIADSGDRESAFRRAKWHSRLVNVLRVALPITAAGLLASYAVFVRHSIRVETATHKGVITTGPVTPSFDNLTMSNPRYDGFNQKDGSQYSVSAEKAVTDLSPKKPVALERITGKLVQPDGTRVSLAAAKGRFFQKTEKLDLFGGIRIETSSGVHAQLSKARVEPKQGIITSDEPVDIWMGAGHVRGTRMVLQQKARTINFDGGVAVRLKPQQAKPQPAGVPAKAAPSVVDLAGNSSEPVDVTAAKLTVFDARNEAVFTGDVRVVQGHVTMTSPSLGITYQNGKAGGTTKPGAKPAAPQIQSPSGIETARAYPRVVIVRDDMRIETPDAQFFAKQNLVVMDGGVVLTAGTNRRASGDRAEVRTDTNDMILTGRTVVLTQGTNVLRGGRVDVKREAGRMRLSNPASAPGSTGRISANFVPKPAQDGKKRAPAPSSGGWTVRTDPNAPVHIEAATLDVDDKARTATFLGHVVATQGAFKISAPLLVAHYAGGGGLLPAGAARAAPTGASSATRLTRVIARNNVVIVSDDGRKAKGDRADFDTANNLVTLTGNVVLEQGKQVIRGPKLVIDTRTGVAKMETSPNGDHRATPNPPAVADKGNRNACGARMCAVFYPQDLKKQFDGSGTKTKRGKTRKDGSARTRVPANIGSGWTSETTERPAPRPN